MCIAVYCVKTGGGTTADDALRGPLVSHDSLQVPRGRPLVVFHAFSHDVDPPPATDAIPSVMPYLLSVDPPPFSA